MSSAPVIRQSIWSLEPTQAFASPVMLNYAKAVRIMQSRADTDPRSWAYQAAIHGSRAPVPAGADWNQCQHGSWFFLPWHRMYIWFFEKIVREAIAEAGADPTGWALPYWNYSDGPLTQVSTLPLAFRVPVLPDGSPNPLHLPYPNRNENTASDKSQGVGLIGGGINDGGQIPPGYVSYAKAVTLSNFSYPPRPDPSFGGRQTGFSHGGSHHGQLEQLPHDQIHVFVGGTGQADCSKGWMTDPDCAAADPVFWTHHSNIDRLWKRWLQSPGHMNPTEAGWLTRSHRLYDPATKSFRTITANDVLDTVSQLGYRYDDDPAPVALPLRPPAALAVPAEPVVSQRNVLASVGPFEVATVATSVTGEFAAPVPTVEALLAAGPGQPRHLSLNLEGVEAEETAPLVFDIYLNLPADQQPEHNSIYFVGHMTFFGHGHHHHELSPEEQPPAGSTFSYEITNLVQEQRTQGVWSDEHFGVTVVVGGYQGPEGIPSVQAASASNPTAATVHIDTVTLTAE